ncbi:hypothetical protein [Sinorhizobium meliloti]
MEAVELRASTDRGGIPRHRLKGVDLAFRSDPARSDDGEETDIGANIEEGVTRRQIRCNRLLDWPLIGTAPEFRIGISRDQRQSGGLSRGNHTSFGKSVEQP